MRRIEYKASWQKQYYQDYPDSVFLLAYLIACTVVLLLKFRGKIEDKTSEVLKTMLNGFVIIDTSEVARRRCARCFVVSDKLR